MIVLAVLAGLFLLPVIHDLFRRKNLRRLGLRNIARRPAEALLVTAGAMLATAIITSSFVVGDTLRESLRDEARTDLGPIDVVVSIDDSARDLETTRTLVTAQPLPGTDGVTEWTWSRASVSTASRDRAEPRAELIEIDFDEARRFGNDIVATGFGDAGPTQGSGTVIISTELSETLAVQAGDQITAFAYGEELDLSVRAVLPHIGLAGRNRMFVAPGTLAAITQATASGEPVAEPPAAEILISNDGGVFDGADNSDAVRADIEARLGTTEGVDVISIKADTLTNAKDEGAGLASIFSGIGSFSVIAGILLLVNLFVMLAEERKKELGLLRAVGVKRNHLSRAFQIEGACYTVAASIVGAFVGLGLGWVVVRLAFSIFLSGDGVPFLFHVSPSSLAKAGLIGFLIGQLTVVLTSSRIARLNVIASLRDLPDVAHSRSRRRVLIASVVGVVAAAALGVLGITGQQPYLALAGPAVAALCTIPLLRRVLPAQLATTIGAGAALAWGVAVFVVAGDAMDSTGIGVFVVQGVVLVTAAVMIASAIADKIRVRGIVSRLGLAYPLARRVRTGLLLGMYALVVFTMVFLSSFSAVSQQATERSVADMAAGFDLVVDSSPSFPATTEQLAALSGVTAVAPLVRGFPEFLSGPDRTAEIWGVTGFTDALFANGEVPKLAARGVGYADDRAAFDALSADASLLIVNDYFLGGGGGPGGERVQVGDDVTVLRADGGESTLRVVGVLASDSIFQGSYMSAAAATDVLADNAFVRRHLVTLDDTSDASATAAEFQGALLANGGIVETIDENAKEDQSSDDAFFNLMRGYLAVGLVIGIAGLGVVMVRAVRERRREIGTLRAIGIPASTVRRAFIVEAVFVALQGILIGAGLGMLSAWCLLSYSTTFGEQQLPFAVPWLSLAIIIAAPLAASALAAAIPAAQASATRPAVALQATT
jgi:putative ABC transport system permease protein